jgi:FtsZ-binding cell division protein ZapB
MGAKDGRSGISTDAQSTELHPRFPRLTMKTSLTTAAIAIAAITLAVLMGSCAPAPRAIIPPPNVVRELDIQPIKDAGNTTRDAVREVAAANAQTREAGRKVSDSTRRLSESIARAEALAVANVEIGKALAETRELADELQAEIGTLSEALALSETKDKIALETIDSLISEIDLLKSNAAAQSAELTAAKASETTLRKQVEALVESADKRAIAEDKLAWWRWRFAPITLGIIAAGILFTVYKPRIPFLT